MKTFNIVTLGCKVNSYEAESVANTLVDKGFKQRYNDDYADIYIVFTCAVTNTAESKTRKKINHVKRLNKDAIIVVVGCYVQINSEALKEDLDINILVGSRNKDKIVDYILNYIKDHNNIISVDKKINEFKFEQMFINRFENKQRAYLKIQDGCNQYCNFCIIPYARGKERSMELEEVIKQANILVNNNHKELVLTGIHTGRYLDSNGHNLEDLLKELLKIEKLERLRLSSIEITEITDNIIELFEGNTKMAKHLHIPLQSGDDTILRKMNRPYDTKVYLDRVNYIRTKIKDISISTDLIVGFPYESEQLFNNTYNFLKQVQFSFIHVFPYAKKVNTVAASFEQQVDEKIKKERVRQVTTLSNNLYKEYMNKFIGKELIVLGESIKDNTIKGHSSEYIPVVINNYGNTNSMIKCRIKSVNELSLLGEV